MRILLTPFIRYWFYPLMLLATTLMCYLTLTQGWSVGLVFSYFTAGRFLLLIGTEFLFPASPAWKMTWASFWRDIKYGATNAIVINGGRFLVGLLALDLASGNPGLLPGAPWFVGLLATALVFEFLQYWFHRFCHEGKGPIGTFLWKMHAAHHLPGRVYLIMHVVMHPINTIAGAAITYGATVAIGASADALFVLLAFRGLHALISHFNVDIRAGFLNYIFIGTELHRYHHSADFKEAKNYGAFLTIWDIVFGTFVYKPGRLPKRLGVDDVTAYPKSNEWRKVMALPFRKEG